MCGVIGFYSTRHDAFADVVNGLFQMQHRGQDACGVAISDGRRIRLHKGTGYVREVFHDRPGDDFAGRIACGHVRYPTQGANHAANAQPHLVTTLDGPIMALCSNGDLTNYWARRGELEARGIDFVSDNDGELLARYLAWLHVREHLDLEAAIRRVQTDIHGAFSACLVLRDRLIAFRDPYGVRPLVFGGNADGDWLVASESVALDIARLDIVGEILPGEIVVFGPDGVSRWPHPDVVVARGGRAEPAQCVFEHVYFSRPDSLTFGEHSYSVRKRIGAWLARNDTVRGDVVVPVPDSSNAVALGYAQEAGLPFDLGLVRNHYVGRTFIRPEQSRRDDSVRLKFNPVREVFDGRKVILIDDSIVRGTTSRKLVRMVRGSGAAEVHLRVGSPVVTNSCFYGIDTPNVDDLIGHHYSPEEIREHLTADTLMYTTVEGLREAVGAGGRFCMACFTGEYPIPLSEAKAMAIGKPVGA